ncbi:MAG TPA: glycosyltransferase [Gammaproteobacteria bacterium]|nr:glycosyltransferase [Gammaproteobacteria bacterium]
MSDSYKISLVMPVLNEESALSDALMALIRDQDFKEIIVVDGGSTDSTVKIVEKFIADHPNHGLRLLCSDIGRAQQMNAGAMLAQSPILLFLHADSRLPAQIGATIVAVMERYHWGFFRIRIDSHNPLLWLVSQMMCWRSTLTAIATGDQALFINTEYFRTLGGFAPIPLMEDIELCRRLKSSGRPGQILEPVRTSARRWQRYGIVRTIVLMWSLRFAYWRGVAPNKLQHRYVNTR